MTDIGHLRSGLTLNLGTVMWDGVSIYISWLEDLPPSARIGRASTLKEARRLLGQLKAKELRTLRRLSSNCRAKKARLNHSPNGPSLIFPRAKEPGL